MGESATTQATGREAVSVVPVGLGSVQNSRVTNRENVCQSPFRHVSPDVVACVLRTKCSTLPISTLVVGHKCFLRDRM